MADPIKPQAAAGNSELTLAQRALLDEVDARGAMQDEFCVALETRSDINKRDLAIARTYLQTGQLWLQKAVSRRSKG